jgi:hypothetical protein
MDVFKDSVKLVRSHSRKLFEVFLDILNVFFELFVLIGELSPLFIELGELRQDLANVLLNGKRVCCLANDSEDRE